MGECLNDLRFDELQSLEKEMESAVKIIRNRKVNIYYIICLAWFPIILYHYCSSYLFSFEKIVLLNEQELQLMFLPLMWLLYWISLA